MHDTRPLAPQPGSRWLRIALAVSVALNLAVVGMVGGAFLKSGGDPRGGVRDLGFGPFTDALTKDDRAELRRAILDRLPEFRDLRRANKADFAGIVAALRAEPYDGKALKVMLDQQNQRTTDRLKLGQSLIFEYVSAMTPTDRLAFADRLEARVERGGRPKP